MTLLPPLHPLCTAYLASLMAIFSGGFLSLNWDIAWCGDSSKHSCLRVVNCSFFFFTTQANP